MIVGDPWIASLAPAFIAAHGYGEAIPYAAALAGALFLVAIGYLLSQGKAEVCNDPT
jgi:hypothetical protein